MLKDVVAFLKEIAQSDHIIGFILGVAGCVALWFFWLRGFLNNASEEKTESLRERNVDLKDRCDDLRRRLEEAREMHDRILNGHRTEIQKYAKAFQAQKKQIADTNAQRITFQKGEADLKAKLAALESEIKSLRQSAPHQDTLRSELTDALKEIAALSESLGIANRLLGERTAERDVLSEELSKRQEPPPLDVDLGWLETFGGKIWDKQPTAPATFVDKSKRSVRFLSVLNLKGGVGKTTISANLGASLVNRGKKVLLVDLDYQGSLTSLCLNEVQVKEIRTKIKFVEGIFRQGGTGSEGLKDWIFPVRDSSNFGIVATEEPLGDVENQLMVRWFLQGSKNGIDDPRYLLRRVFHANKQIENYDFVIFDCPPRLTTACINAITCTDYVVIPVIPDERSTEAVPRLLASLRDLREKSVCPDLEILGVIANRTYASFKTNTLAHREAPPWLALPKLCKIEMPNEPIRYFQTSIRQFTNEAYDAIKSDRFAAHSKNFGEAFDDLTKEMLSEIHSRERGKEPI